MAGSYESDANNNHVANTYMGYRSVPITSSCQELMDVLERFRWDIPFTAEVIRKSTVDFTYNQLILVQEVLDNANIARQFGYEQQFFDELINFEASLKSRIGEEKIFFTQQKRRYTEIYEILRQSSFPYSASQAACLNRMVGALYQITGNPSSDADKVFVIGLKALVRLLQLDDHLRDPTPNRVMVTNTLHFYIQGMVIKLERLANEEGGRPTPDFIHPDSQIDLAIYLVVNLGALVDVSKVLTPREHFHYGMVEIYTKFVEIFTHSGLRFSVRQQAVIQMIERRIRDLKKDPLVSKHHGIGEACLEFMSELEENNPDREVTLENGKVVWDTNGIVNKAVREISWWLVNLQHATSNHLINFPSFGDGVDNVIAKAMERFLALYPMH